MSELIAFPEPGPAVLAQRADHGAYVAEYVVGMSSFVEAADKELRDAKRELGIQLTNLVGGDAHRAFGHCCVQAAERKTAIR